MILDKLPPRWKELLTRYAHFLWWGAVGAGALLCVGLLAGLWLSGSREAQEAVADGRRLLIALDTGEVTGTILGLDGKPVPQEPPKPAEPPKEEKPQDDAKPQEETKPPQETPAGITPPPVPQPDTSGEVRTPTAEPNPALTEHTEDGNLPIIGSDGAKPWRYYSKNFERKRNLPMVAVVVSGLGVGREISKASLDLPENVTLSFSPYAPDLENWARSVRASGHELMIDLPLQPTNYPATDPGPSSLMLDKGPAETEKRLRALMSRLPAYIGFLTPVDESFTANDDAFRLLLQSMANRGLLMVMSVEPHKKETHDILEASPAAALVAGVLIDEELSDTSIQARLTLLEEQARKQGYAVGVAQAYPLTVVQLQAWSKTLAEKGLVLVPVSAIAKLRFS